MTALSTAEILCGAKTVLETNGWHQRAEDQRWRHSKFRTWEKTDYEPPRRY